MSIYPIQNKWNDSSVWTTSNVSPEKQFEHWCNFVNTAHLTWSIDRFHCERFPAFIREGRFEDFRVVNLTSPMGNIRGVRNSTEISSDAQELYNILYIVDGTERLIFNGQEVDLNSGSIIIWDSTRPMKFITGNKLHQVTLSISHDRMRRFFPTIDDCIAIHFDTKKGASRLFANHLLTLDAEFGNLYHQQAKIVFDSTLQLLFSVLEGERFCNNCPTAITNLSAICAYINENLDDLNLSISSLASHFEISVRHLHRLFHNEETTLAGYILRKRLDRCSQELSSSVYRSQRITEIAYKWGFNDSSTFSKIFKREIGLTPREYRKKTLNNIR